MDVWGQVEEGEDLCHTGRSDLGIAGEFGLVGELAGEEQFVAVDSQRHEATDAGDLALRGIGRGTWRR